MAIIYRLVIIYSNTKFPFPKEIPDLSLFYNALLRAGYGQMSLLVRHDVQRY